MFPTMSPLNRRPTRHSTTTCHINNGGNINKNGSNSNSNSSSSSSSLHRAGNEVIYRRRGIKNNSSCCSLRCGPSLAFFLASQRSSWIFRRWNNSSFGRFVSRIFSKIASTATYWKRRRPKTTIASFLIAISLSTYLLSILVLGPKGSIQGGLLGITVDQILRDCTYYKTIRKWRNQIQNELHIPIHYIDFFTSEGDWKEPLWFPYDPSIRSRSHAAVVEMLLREKRRSKMLERVATMSLGWKRKCSKGDILSGDIVSSGRQENGIAKVVWHLDPSILEQNRNINKNRSHFIHDGVAGEMNNLLPYWISRPSSTKDEIDLIKIYQTDMESSPSLSEIVSTCREYSNTIATEISSRSDSDFYSCWSFLIGGMQLGDFSALHFSRPQITSILVSLSPSSTSSSLSPSSMQSSTTNYQFPGGSCNSKLGYAVLSSSPSPPRRVHDDAHNPPTSSPNSKRVTTIFTALPPYHPASLCLPPLHHGVEIFPYNEINEVLSYQSTFANNLEKNLLRGDDSNKSIVNDGDASAPQLWGVATLPCSVEIDNENTAMTTSSIRACCNQVKIDILDSFDTTVIDKFLSKERDDNSDHSNQSIRHHLLFSFANLPHSDPHHNIPVASTFETVPSISVTISETVDTETMAKGNVPRRRKNSIQKELQSKWACEPGWLCNRCLKAAIFGSFSKCSVVCSKCFRETICNDTAPESSKNDDNHGGSRREVAVNVKVSINPVAASGVAYPQRRIPRIIHQTYFDEITPTMYPQLYRLQNSWRASGWEYRFYNDEMARDYIRSNYPSRFLAVFDSLLPGAYKADFFRCLILYKEGGLYADVDVMLETNLDTFLTDDLSFVIPLDAVGSYADEQFCAWNGLIGSAPAHPILTKAIEWMVNHASDRADMYDMERSICHLSGKEAGMENWKIRAEPLLLLTGPCALGVAINAALGREPLARLEPGVLKRSSLGGTNFDETLDDYDDIGDILFLLGDKDDLGAFRFSDPDRNLIVASTDVPGLSGKPMRSTRVVGKEGGVRKKKKKKVKPHYSVTNGGQKLWGTHDVYADDLVDEEHITLVVSHDVV